MSWTIGVAATSSLEPPVCPWCLLLPRSLAVLCASPPKPRHLDDALDLPSGGCPQPDSMTVSQPESVTAPVVPRCLQLRLDRLALRLQTVVGALEPDPRGYIRRRTNQPHWPSGRQGVTPPSSRVSTNQHGPFRVALS
jgi:hypothetical protein